MKTLISYFINRKLLSNIIFVGVLLLGIFTWNNIGKEEMPEFTSNWIRINTIYPGAPAEDVELFITKPIEDELKGLVGIEEVISTSSLSSSSISITLDDKYPDKKEVLQDIQEAVLRVKFPSEVRDLPVIRQFKSSEKAILDIGIYHKDKKLLDPISRSELQSFVLSFENQMLSKKEISSISRSHYRKPELQIMVSPKDILKYEISLSQIKSQIQDNNIRVPIGSLEDRGESKVTALNELEDDVSLGKLLLRSTYEGVGVKLSDLASINYGHEKTNSIFKVNGHEAIFLNIKKSISTDIITANKEVSHFIESFKKANKDAPIGIVQMDDESYAVRERLRIISSNAVLGFVLIIIVLFIFLDLKSGFWVAMGIPFCLSFTLIIAYLVGYTVNNMTLAGIIIVLGIVVDDAIIIAENIARKREQGLDLIEASVMGAKEVVKPIFASILTTCVAFIPLIYFEGFFGKLVTYIPLVVALMLAGSLLESFFVLPSHLSTKSSILDRFSSKDGGSWFLLYEKKYEKFLLKVFSKRVHVICLFILFLSSSLWVFKSEMKFVMFPREESKEVFIKVKAPAGTIRSETSSLIEPLEELMAKDKDNVVGVRSSIGLSRRGGAVKENEASILVEVLPANERDIPLRKLIEKWEKKSKELKGLESVKFQKGRWGHGSGNSIEIQIQENDNSIRDIIAKTLENKMKAMSELTDVEIDEPLRKKEFLLKLKQPEMVRFNVSPSQITTVLRSFVEGSILYSINKGEEEVDVRLSVPASEKNNLQELLKLRVDTKSGQLIYLKNVVEISEVVRPINITRSNYKRSTMVYANISAKVKTTPLDVAAKLENDVFPELTNEYTNSILSFKGEVEDTRESQGEFVQSSIAVIVLIYFILIIMFNSLIKPFVILSIIPFGLAGVIFVFLAHGMSIFGFFAVIGTLGMIGVVINDAIVMIDKIESSVEVMTNDKDRWGIMAHVCSTRLRPVLLTTLTTVVGIIPTAYGFAGYDSMLAEMMLAMGWGLVFGTLITLILIPCIYTFIIKRKI